MLYFNLLTTTMIESCCLKFLGRPVIKSILIVSHFHSRMGSGYNNPAWCWCSALTCRHSRQWAKYSTTFFMFHQNKSFLIMEIIFWYRGFPEYGLLCSSSMTVYLVSLTLAIYSLFLYNNSPCWFRLKSYFTCSCSF